MTATQLPELKAATRTAKALSRKQMPKALKEHLAAHGFRNRSVRLIAFSDEGRAVRCDNVNWSGGTRNRYGVYDFRGGFYTISVPEGEEIRPAEGRALVVMSYFQGENCTPAVYVREQDLAAFFGEEVPEGLSALIAADWLDDKAMWEKPRAAKRMRAVAQVLREFCAA